MVQLFNFTQNVNLNDFTLIIPSVSVGNIPQLTLDLIITTLNMTKSATIWHPAVIPSVGGDPYTSNATEICTACELYTDESHKIAAIQIRSALDAKLVLKFFNDLLEAFKSFNLRKIIILSSAFDYELHNINSDKFYYLGTAENDKMSQLNVKQLDIEKTSINGSGFGLKLYETLERHFQCMLLIKYASEGDNRPDALMTLDKVFRIIGYSEDEVKNVKFPSSWDFVFGSPPPVGIY